MNVLLTLFLQTEVLYDPLFSVNGRATSAIYKDPANKEHLFPLVRSFASYS